MNFFLRQKAHVGKFEREILFKLFCLIKRGKQYKYVMKIPSIEERLQTRGEIFEQFIFKIAHKNFR